MWFTDGRIRRGAGIGKGNNVRGLLRQQMHACRSRMGTGPARFIGSLQSRSARRRREIGRDKWGEEDKENYIFLTVQAKCNSRLIVICDLYRTVIDRFLFDIWTLSDFSSHLYVWPKADPTKVSKSHSVYSAGRDWLIQNGSWNVLVIFRWFRETNFCPKI